MHVTRRGFDGLADLVTDVEGGFDPRPWLRDPGPWIFGARDRHVPVKTSVEQLAWLDATSLQISTFTRPC